MKWTYITNLLLSILLLVPTYGYPEKAKKDELETSLAEEVTARKQADAALQSAIDAEVLDRQAGDELLESTIGTEALTRLSVDTTLQAAIDAGVSEREDIVESMRFFLPPTLTNVINPAGCLVGGHYVCLSIDGEPRLICLDTTIICDPGAVGGADPDFCPEACEELGRVVVSDIANVSCDSAIAQPLGFVCMTQDEYALRPGCPDGTILNYNSSRGGWVCDPLVPPVIHVSTDVYDLVNTISLFERARIKLVEDDLQSQIDGFNQICVCPGNFNPVCAVNQITYVNNCEAECAGQPIAYVGQCQ